MTFDAELLKTIFTKVAEERFAKEIHEWIIYTAPEDVLKMYREYLDTVSEQDIKIDE